MSRYGLPDYGMYAALENMGNLVDYGELAARLGSIVTFNREGNIVFWDDFEKTPLKWDEIATGGTGSVNYSSETALSGGQCVKAVTGGTIYSKAGIGRRFLETSIGQMGMEFAFAFESLDNTIYMVLTHDDGSSRKSLTVRLVCSSDILEVSIPGMGYITVLTDLGLYPDKHLFHHLKIAVNIETEKCVRVVFDRYEVNLSQYPLYENFFTMGKFLETQVYVYTPNSISKTFYIDNFILTQNEP